MNHFLIPLFMFALFAAQAQPTAILDGYTLSPLSTFTVTASDPSVVFSTRGSYLSYELPKKTYLVISSEGFENDTIRPKEDYSNIALRPTKEQLDERWKEFSPLQRDPDYSSIPDSLDAIAEFPGGKAGMFKFIADHVRYPQPASDMEIEGKVYVRFVVEADGSISNISIAKGVQLEIDLESMRVVRMMPKWAPAQKDGENVRSVFTLPITFKLW